jgi:hypothetical protein
MQVEMKLTINRVQSKENMMNFSKMLKLYCAKYVVGEVGVL